MDKNIMNSRTKVLLLLLWNQVEFRIAEGISYLISRKEGPVSCLLMHCIRGDVDWPKSTLTHFHSIDFLEVLLHAAGTLLEKEEEKIHHICLGDNSAMQKSSLFFYDAAAPWINLASRLSEVDHIYLFFPWKMQFSVLRLRCWLASIWALAFEAPFYPFFIIRAYVVKNPH